MNEKIKQVHEESIDEILKNLSPLQQIKKLKELLLDSYDTSYDLARRMVKAIIFLETFKTDSKDVENEWAVEICESTIKCLKGSDKE